jgi:hypothetical protein
MMLRNKVCHVKSGEGPQKLLVVQWRMNPVIVGILYFNTLVVGIVYMPRGARAVRLSRVVNLHVNRTSVDTYEQCKRRGRRDHLVGGLRPNTYVCS